MKKLLTKTKLVEEPPPPPTESTPKSTSTTTPLIGKTLKLQTNTVTISEVIAEGGFGIVYLTHNNKHSPFALKRIVVNNNSDLEVAEREISILSLLQPSPFILQLIDHTTTKLTPDITEVLSLTNYCKSNLLTILTKAVSLKQPLKEQQVLEIFSDIIQGVDRLHSLKIIHRDLKIENLLENNGTYLICDFGSATMKVWDPEVDAVLKIQEELEKYTTLSYRAPEMVDLYSGRGAITTKSDLWAMGVVLYKLCYWTTPFGDSILAIQSGKKLDYPPGYSQEMQSLISYMLIPDQCVRPDVTQVSELVHTLLGVPNPLQTNKKPLTFQEITDYLSKTTTTDLSIEKVESIKKIQVLETSVTPRSRPKASVQQLQPEVEKMVLMPPPKSPKLERKEVEPTENSWNPFAEDSVTVANVDDSDDPFAAAPFDYFQYQPMQQTNPFTEGEVNFSFEEV